MAGALALMMLNRLQMLKESRGQECKRPDRKREREERRERGGKKPARDAAGPYQDPRGDVTNRRVTSVSFFQHKVVPVFPPFPSATQQYASKPFLAAFLASNPPLSYQYHIC